MRKFVLFLTILCMISYNAIAVPTDEDKNIALELMYSLSNSQEEEFYRTSNYKTIQPIWVDGFMPSVCAYSTFEGKGYIMTVKKTEGTKIYQIQRQYGPEDLNIDGHWTCLNCNGEYSSDWLSEKANKHGFCNVEAM